MRLGVAVTRRSVCVGAFIPRNKGGCVRFVAMVPQPCNREREASHAGLESVQRGELVDLLQRLHRSPGLGPSHNCRSPVPLTGW
jgi:hypothetical protein